MFGPAALAQTVDFARDVSPLLTRCQACHGPQQQMGGLRLDLCESALQGGNSGPLLQQGKSVDSRLIHYLTGQTSPLNPKGLRMPVGGPPLDDKDLNTIRVWINSGAVWPLSDKPSITISQQKLPCSFLRRVSRWCFPGTSTIFSN